MLTAVVPRDRALEVLVDAGVDFGWGCHAPEYTSAIAFGNAYRERQSLNMPFR
jgi:hypothetical protein